jgi:hypothetical protein
MDLDHIFTVSPATLYFNAIPGQQIDNVVQVENKGSQPITLQVVPYGIKIIDSSGHVRLTSEGKLVSSWITVKNSSITLEPKEKKFVPLSVKIPPETAKGSYSGSLGFTNHTSMMKVTKGTVVHIDIGKSLSTRLQLVDFKQKILIKNLFAQSAQIQLLNTGEIIAQPSGHIAVTGLNGAELTNVQVRDILISPHSAWDKTYILPIQVPGIYNIQIKLMYNHGEKAVYADTWIISPLLLFLLAFISFGTVIGLFINHHRKKWKKRKKR